MVNAAEQCPYGFSEREGRAAVRTVIRELSSLTLPPAPGETLPSVEAVLGIEPFPADSDNRKLDRYAFCAGTILNRFLPQIVAGDGPEQAHFVAFADLPEGAPGKGPYAHFRRRVEQTFSAGWDHYRDLDNLRANWAIDTYHDLLAADPTTRACGSPVNEAIIQAGVEAPLELAYYGLAIGVAASRQPQLRDAPATALLQAARQSRHALSRKGRLPLRFVYWDRLNYHDTNYGALHLSLTASGRWRLEAYDGLFAPYDPAAGDLAGIGPTVRCPADLIRLQPGDRYTALDNVIFAGINALHDNGLFDPPTALRMWQRHQEIDRELGPMASFAFRKQALLQGREKLVRQAVRDRCSRMDEIV